MKPVKVRMFFWRWHKRIGITSALVLILLSITGIFLNHSSHLNLAAKPIKARWLLNLYGVEIPEFTSVKLTDNWVTQVGGHLYINQLKLIRCEGDLIGAQKIPDSTMWLTACTQQFLLFTEDNILVEAIGQAQGLPLPIQSLGICENTVCFTANNSLIKADFENLNWQTVRQVDYIAATTSPPPQQLKAFYQKEFVGSDLTWERIVQDIHAARFLGKAGPWILDIFVVLFLFLSLSGFYLWYSKLRHFNNPSK